jgi:hypothetical protein
MLQYSSKKTLNKGEAMGYKRIGKMITFADIAVKRSLENNRSVQMMERIKTGVTWKNIEALLVE